MRNEQEIVQAIERYADMVQRLCWVYLKNSADTEDVFQNVFLKYALRSAVFESPEHEKAWLIRVTVNACKDELKSAVHRRTVPLSELKKELISKPEEENAVLDAVMALPSKYREVVYLHFYEGYTAPEIGALLRKKTNTVYTHLTRAKALLRDMLGGDEDV